MRLHSLLQTAVPMRREEACYVLSKLEAALARALNAPHCEAASEEDPGPRTTAAASGERCSWLVPLVRTLLDRAYGPLGLQWGLPSLPPTNGSPTFFEDFQAFCTTPEWRHFIDKQVRGTGAGGEVGREPTPGAGLPLTPPSPGAAHHVPVRDGHLRQEPRPHVRLLELLLRHAHEQRAAAPGGARAQPAGFPGACAPHPTRASLPAGTGRGRGSHGRSPPQELVLEPVQRRARLEGLRYSAAHKQQAAQLSTAQLHWGALWRRLSSPCGAWALRWAWSRGGACALRWAGPCVGRAGLGLLGGRGPGWAGRVPGGPRWAGLWRGVFSGGRGGDWEGGREGGTWEEPRGPSLQGPAHAPVEDVQGRDILTHASEAGAQPSLQRSPGSQCPPRQPR